MVLLHLGSTAVEDCCDKARRSRCQDTQHLFKGIIFLFIADNIAVVVLQTVSRIVDKDVCPLTIVVIVVHSRLQTQKQFFELFESRNWNVDDVLLFRP